MERFYRWSFLLGIIGTLTSAENFPNDDNIIHSFNWTHCKNFKETLPLPNCLCLFDDAYNGFRVNCDNIVFSQDIPNLPFRQRIISFSNRYINLQNLPPQAFLAGGNPIQNVDLSHNWLRRLSDKSLDGLSETLETLDLSWNYLGDQLNPIFSTGEFRNLPRLRVLKMSRNMITNVDGGILEGALSLQEFYLDNNELNSVPTLALKGPNAMRMLDLSYNQIDNLHSTAFIPQPSLLHINLSHNEIHSIHGNAFTSLTNLKFLNLQWNRLHRLNSDTFNGLATIEDLDLSYNYFTSIPFTALKTVDRTLKRLKLSGNLIGNLEDFKSTFRNLEVLDLSRNRINEIPKGFFNGMGKLKSLDLGVNQLRTIPPTTFQSLPGLTNINLMDNNLLTFPTAALTPLANHLKVLILDYNRISALVPMQLPNLTTLSISHNLIRDLPSETFITNFPILTNLNLYGNLIESIDEVQLPQSLEDLNIGLNSLQLFPRFQLANLQNLNLSRNQLYEVLPHNFVLLTSLRSLDLSWNGIKNLHANSFDGIENIQRINLAKNHISKFPSPSTNLNQLTHLDLSKNQLKEIVDMNNFPNLQVLDLGWNDISNIKATSAPVNASSKLQVLKLNNNLLNSFRGFGDSFPMEKLQLLYLNNNQITYVYPNSFDNMKNLLVLDFNNNRFTFFPTEFLKKCENLIRIGLSGNYIKNLNEMNFSNFGSLRTLDLSQNQLEGLSGGIFVNTTQLQNLDLSGNKLENIDGDLFYSVNRLELDLSNNYLSSLPSNLFPRTHVYKLHRINLSQNSFTSIPSEALQKQYFYLEELNMSYNSIVSIPSNLNILVNVKNLDLSNNPLDHDSLNSLLSEPKTVRYLNISTTGLHSLQPLEMPFLRSLILSNNPIVGIIGTTFTRTTLLHTLELSNTSLNGLESRNIEFPKTLKHLDLSNNPGISVIGGNVQLFPTHLQSLKLNNLDNLTKLEKASLNLKQLKRLEITNVPKLGYLDIRGLLGQMEYLEEFDFEVKDSGVVDQLHPGLGARVKEIGLRGRRIKSISTGAFAGLTSPSIRISLTNTSLSTLPSILVPVPMSTSVILDLTGSKITNLSPPFLSQKIILEGLSPICDCNAVGLVKYLQAIESQVKCSGPRSLQGANVIDLDVDELICESGSSTSTTPQVITISTTTTTTPAAPLDDIIWSLAPPSPKTPSKSRERSKNKLGHQPDEVSSSTKVRHQMDINNMDNLIIGIVGGVVGLIVLFVLIIVCFVKMSSGSGRSDPTGSSSYPMPPPSVMSVQTTHPHHHYGSSKNGANCTCKGEGIYVQRYATTPSGNIHPNSYATVRSINGAKYLSQQYAQQSNGTAAPMSMNMNHQLVAYSQPQYYHPGSSSLPYFLPPPEFVESTGIYSDQRR